MARIATYLLGLVFAVSCAGFVFAQGAAEDNVSQASGGSEELSESKEDNQLLAAEEEKAPALAGPVLEIKRLDTENPLYSIELRDVDLADLFRVLAHDYKLNILLDNKVAGKITASFTNISLEEAIEGIAEIGNLALQKKGSIIRVYPNLVTKTFSLNYIEAKKILEISSSASETVSAAGSEGASGETGTADTAAAETAQANTIYDLISESGKVLLGRQPNSIIVIDYPPNIEKVEEYLKAVDQKMTSRVFKLKYLKAADVVGQTAANTQSAETTTASSETASTGSASTSSAAAGG